MRLAYKILIFIIGIMLFMQYEVYAQRSKKSNKFAYNVTKTPTFGLKGGLLLSTIEGDEAIDQFAKNIGPQIGITGAFYFSAQFSVRSELNYELKGGFFDNHEMKTSLQYASLPVYLKFNFIKDPEIYIYGGGYASYLLAAKTKGTYEISIGNDDITESIDEDISPNLNKFDAGVVIGLGVQGRFNNQMDIFLDFRYTFGIMNLDNGTAEYRYNFNYAQFWPEQETDNPTNKSLMLTTGFIYYIDAR